MQNVKPFWPLDRIAERFLWFDLESVLRDLRDRGELRVRGSGGKFTGGRDRHVELRGDLREPRAFLQQRLDKLVRAIRHLLERVHFFFPGQFLFRFPERERREFHFALFVRFQFRLMRLVIFRDILVGDVHVLLKIVFAKANDGDVQFSVGLLVKLLALRFGDVKAGAEQIFHAVEYELI